MSRVVDELTFRTIINQDWDFVKTGEVADWEGRSAIPHMVRTYQYENKSYQLWVEVKEYPTPIVRYALIPIKSTARYAPSNMYVVDGSDFIGVLSVLLDKFGG